MHDVTLAKIKMESARTDVDVAKIAASTARLAWCEAKTYAEEQVLYVTHAMDHLIAAELLYQDQQISRRPCPGEPLITKPLNLARGWAAL